MLTNNVVTTWVGNPYQHGSQDGEGTNATFSRLQGIAADGAGNFYLTDAGNNLIRKVTAGGRVLAQDEASSVVWGMPGAIAQDGLCHAILPLPALGPKILDLLRGAA